MLRSIRSGGQTGVDRAALYAARERGYEAGGYCPAGFRAEDGQVPPDLRPFLTCTDSPDYEERTRLNVEAADATLIICAGQLAGGTRLTAETAAALGKPVLVVDPEDPSAAGTIRRWLGAHPAVETLNVAGPRESEQPGIGEATRHLLLRALPLIA